MRSEPVNDGPWTYKRQSGAYFRVNIPRAVFPSTAQFLNGLEGSNL